MEFSVEEALLYEQRGEIEIWIELFLNGPGNNPSMVPYLKRTKRFWGKLRVLPLAPMVRYCGPEEGMRFYEHEESWSKRVRGMIESLEKGWKPAPLIVHYDNGIRHISDGSHRLEALQKHGHTEYWAITFYDVENEWKDEL
jgi:hypothetical protein